MSGIKQKTISALIWNGVDKLGVNIIYFILGIVLARLLSPNDYGLMGIISIFTAFAGTIIDSGLSTALIRKKDATSMDYNSIFYFNLAGCLFLYLLLWILAPIIADFFGKQELTTISRTAFSVLLINAIGTIQLTKLSKELDFKNITVANILSLSISGALGVISAFKGFGVWALVIQLISGAIVKTGYVWYISNWRPKLQFSLQSIKEMLSFSISILGASIVNLVYLNSYSFIIGRIFSMSALGYFTQGTKWSDMFVNSLGGIFRSATLPVFSALQDNKEMLIKSYRKMMRLAAFCSFPLLFGLVFFAKPMVMVVLSSKWEPSIIYIQLLGGVGVITVFSILNQNFVTVAGKSALLLRIEIYKLIFSFGAIALTYKHGVLMIVAGLFATRLIVYIVTTWMVGRIVEYRLHQQLLDVLPYFAITIFSGIAGVASTSFTDSYLIQLVMGGLVFAGCYLGLVKLLGSVVFDDLMEFIQSNK